MGAKRHTWPRGICAHCDRDVALLSDGRVNSRHWPCPGTGHLPREVLVTKRVALDSTPDKPEGAT